MNESAYDAARHDLDRLAYRALGQLLGIYQAGAVPPAIRDHVAKIVAEYDRIQRAMAEAIESPERLAS